MEGLKQRKTSFLWEACNGKIIQKNVIYLNNIQHNIEKEIYSVMVYYKLFSEKQYILYIFSKRFLEGILWQIIEKVRTKMEMVVNM